MYKTANRLAYATIVGVWSDPLGNAGRPFPSFGRPIANQTTGNYAYVNGNNVFYDECLVAMLKFWCACLCLCLCLGVS